MNDRNRRSGQRALDLFEEAVHLLRTAPATGFVWYSFGTLSFILGLLYFWTDMSWSADAQQDCAINAAGVAILFVWMKFCHSQFTQRLRAHLSLEPSSEIRFGHALRMLVQQAILQPSKLFVLPIGLMITIPFGWLVAFYESATAFGEARNIRTLWSKSWRQARLWPRQNHITLATFILLYVVMSLNLLLILITIPRLVKTVTGAENVFTKSGLNVFNSTSLAVVLLLAYFCCDPLLKAVYVLRCYYGESLHSGEDLRAELRRLQRNAVTTVGLFLFLSLAIAPTCGAAPDQPPRQTINVSELDRSISDTIVRPEFRWRMPRELSNEKDAPKANAFDRAVRRFMKTLKKWFRTVGDWLDRLFPRRQMPEGDTSERAGQWSRSVLEIILIVLFAGLLIILGLRVREYYRRTRVSPASPSQARKVDLAKEGVTADQLPEDEWLSLARELISQREWRLALRALFLAGLAHLSTREMVALARHKSNRDYQGELRRKIPAKPEIHDAFGSNLREVERAWYGEHEVSEEILTNFQSNLEKIRTV